MKTKSIWLLLMIVLLAAMMHANTNYPLSPLVTQQPALGLLFMVLMLAGARMSGRGKSLVT